MGYLRGDFDYLAEDTGSVDPSDPNATMISSDYTDDPYAYLSQDTGSVDPSDPNAVMVPGSYTATGGSPISDILNSTNRILSTLNQSVPFINRLTNDVKGAYATDQAQQAAGGLQRFASQNSNALLIGGGLLAAFLFLRKGRR
jgi:hypothetical protein